MLFRSAPATVAAWLDALPDETRDAPELRMIEGRLAAGAGELERAVPALTEAIAGYAAGGEIEREWRMRVLLSDVLAMLERYDAAAPLADGFDQVDAYAAPMTAISVACAHARASRFGEAAELFERALAHPRAAPLTTLAGGFRGAFLDFPQAKLDGALAGLREVVGALERFDPSNRLPLFLGYGALIHDERGENDAALDMADRLERLTERSWMGGYVGGLAHTFKAGLHARLGRLAEAELELGRVRPLVRNWAAEAYVARAALAAGRGDHEAASDAAAAAIDNGALDTWLGRARLTAVLVPVLVDAGQPSWARELLDGGLEACPASCRAPRLYAQRAWLRRNEGDDPGALEDLAAAWHEAGSEAQHLVRREWRWVEPLMWTALEAGTLPPDEAIAAIEAAIPGGAALIPFTRHPLAEVRRSALVSAVASGHPEAPRLVAELERDGDAGVAGAARASGRRLASEPPPLVFTLLGGFGLRRGSFYGGRRSMGAARGAAARAAAAGAARRAGARGRAVRGLLAGQAGGCRAARAPGGGVERARRARPARRRAHLDRRVGALLPAAPAPGRLGGLRRVRARRRRRARRGRAGADCAAGGGGCTLVRRAAARGPLRGLGNRLARAPARPLRPGARRAGGRARRRRPTDGRAIDAGRSAVEVDPLDEGAHRRLMLSYSALRPPRSRAAAVSRLPASAGGWPGSGAGGGDGGAPAADPGRRAGVSAP